MPFINYKPHRFRRDNQRLVEQASDICLDYAAQGYTLTVRQCYYQMVSRGLIPNNQRSYNRLARVIEEARMAGQMDWAWIIDRTRMLHALPHWDSPGAAIKDAAAYYRHDKWANQPTRVEVWIEKDALLGVIEPICQQLQVDYFSCRGYTSTSEVWRASQRILGHLQGGQNVLLLHLADHDPSGIDMTRDVEDRMLRFLKHDVLNSAIDADLLEQKCIDAGVGASQLHKVDPKGYQDVMDDAATTANTWGKIEIRRIALTMDQVDEYQPPPNPAKITDSRSRGPKGYIRRFGRSSWELDALTPDVLSDLIHDNVVEVRNERRWRRAVRAEKTEIDLLGRVVNRWDEVAGLVSE